MQTTRTRLMALVATLFATLLVAPHAGAAGSRKPELLGW